MLQLLDSLFLRPLLAIYGFIFDHLTDGLGGDGFKIICFGIVVNLALIPVYSQMEQRSGRARVIRDLVTAEVARMKRYFRGRERYFYIRAVYRQHRYHPISELLGSADLIIQVLIFATVYRFLSNLDALVGQSFGLIVDLGGPDALLGGVNLLPILMTLINAAAVFSYMESRTKRIQALLLALIFLVLLYDSPSGLVLYWTVNNLFSLIRSFAARRGMPSLIGTLSVSGLASQR